MDQQRGMPARQWTVGEGDPREIAAIVKASVVPRPIAWVSTRGADGVLNLAPHSYFMVLNDAPPVLGFVSSGRKDTLRNIEATGDYVVNILGDDLVEAMNVTAANFPATEDEFAWAGLTPEPSQCVNAPRVAEAPVAFELRHRETRNYGTDAKPSSLIVGDVLHIRIHQRVLDGVDGHHVLPAQLRAVARMGGPATYARTTDRFDLPRPTWDPDRETITRP
jgi:flavin reductase (DIM6/NTAB) family NADH-FMN oxidoreductase RutF